MRPKHRWLAIIGLVWLAGCIALLGFALYRNTNEKVLDAYALDWTATLVIEHLDRHQGAWPKGWEDLRATAERMRKESPSGGSAESSPATGGGPEDIDQLRKRVRVVWDVDSRKLLKEAGEAEVPPWQVIELRSGRPARFQNQDPNQKILDHLRVKLGRVGAR